MKRSISIKDQINHQYREYALYVIQSRGIPNFYDGLTPVQRLILQNSPTRFNKTIGVVGEVIRTGLYHHGDSSLAGSISKLARPFGCSYQILEGDGFFGSPVNPNPSAPRYTSVKISEFASEVISKHADLNEKNHEGGYDWIHVEVPLGLLTHVVGIAVGYRSNILPRKSEDVIEYLEGKNKLLKPYFRDFTGKVTKLNGDECYWVIESNFESNESTRKIRIYDLPPVMRYDSFIRKLTQKLESLGVNFILDNNSQSKCDITLTLPGLTKEDFLSNSNWIENLCKIVVKENVVLVKDGSVIEFDSVKEYLDNFRIHLESTKLKRISKDLENSSWNLSFLQAKLLFLKFMTKEKRNNSEISEFLKGFDKKISGKLSSIPAIKLSDETIKETEELIVEEKRKISEFKKEINLQQQRLESIKEKTVVKKSISLISSEMKDPELINGIEVYQIEEGEEEEKDEEV